MGANLRGNLDVFVVMKFKRATVLLFVFFQDAHSKNYPDFDASLTPSTVKNAMDVNWSQIVNKLNEELQKKSERKPEEKRFKATSWDQLANPIDSYFIKKKRDNPDYSPFSGTAFPTEDFMDFMKAEFNYDMPNFEY